MSLDSYSVLQALAELAMEGAESPIRLVDISELDDGVADVQFVVSSTGERCGLHVPTPSSTRSAPWVGPATTTPRLWAEHLHTWLVEQVTAADFAQARRVSYLSLDGDGLRH